MHDVNWIAASVAALATFVIGGPWYSPAMFLKSWQREMNMTDQQPAHPAKVFGLAYVFSVASCALLSALIGTGSGALAGAGMGLLVGICFIAASFGVNYQFANRSFKAWLIDGGYHALQFGAFGLVLGAWPW
jgi:hypothetical protein